MTSLAKFILFFALIAAATVRAEWVEYSDTANKSNIVTFSTTSLKRFDDVHYMVTVFTNYSGIQNIELNKRKIQFQSKSQTQMFGCETQDFALGDYELYQDRDAMGSKTQVNQNELLWKPITPASLQMDLLKKFCQAVKG